jgi:hypothetical protein
MCNGCGVFGNSATTKCQLTAVMAVLLLSTAFGGAPVSTAPATAPNRDHCALTVSIPDNNTLRISVQSGKGESLILDKDLTIPLYLQFYDKAGDPIELERIEAAEEKPTRMSERLLRVEHGASLEREIDLQKPFLVWCCGHATRKVEGHLVHAPFGAERWYRVPKGKEISKVDVSYAVSNDDEDGFRQYTGMSMSQAGLFKGTLTASASMAK